jgi:hypothetical protein
MPDSRDDLTAADLIAARRRDPATVARIHQAHANGLFRLFLASTGDEHVVENLTGSVFAATTCPVTDAGGADRRSSPWTIGSRMCPRPAVTTTRGPS